MPGPGRRRRRRQIGGIAVWRSGRDPVSQHLLIGFGHVARVGESTVLRTRMPRRHPAIIDYLDHRVGPADDFVVVGQRERPDFAGLMALHAIRLQDLGDVAAIREFRVFGALLYSPNQTTGDLGLRHAHGFAREQLLQRDPQDRRELS